MVRKAAWSEGPSSLLATRYADPASSSAQAAPLGTGTPAPPSMEQFLFDMTTGREPTQDEWTQLSPTAKKILLNEDAIAVSQDPEGRAGVRLGGAAASNAQLQTWVRPLV